MAERNTTRTSEEKWLNISVKSASEFTILVLRLVENTLSLETLTGALALPILACGVLENEAL